MIYKGCYLYFYMDLMFDFVKLVEVYGYVGIKVDKFDELDVVMEKCFSYIDCLVFMDIVVD